MKVLDVPRSLPERVDYLLPPVVVRPGPRERELQAETAAWRELIEGRLSSWAKDPGQLGDEGIQAPSASMVELAIDVLRVLRDQRVDAPDRVVPNGDGGIVFRWQSADVTWNLELDADGSMETSLLERDGLVSRHILHAKPVR